MRRRLAAAAVFGSVMSLGPLGPLGPSPARAESCGSRGGGGGGGSSGGGGGGGSIVGAGAAQRCEDTSDVVGYRQCTKFGAWGMNTRIPRLTIEGGVLVRQFKSRLSGQIGTFRHGDESFSYRAITATASPALDTAVLSTVRASLGLPHGLYAAAEIDFGGLVAPGRAATEMMSSGALGDPALRQDGGFIVDSLATVGLRGSGRAGGIAVELSGGMRAVSYGFHSRYHDCVAGSSVLTYAPIAEARARGELWLSPWLTAGVTVGTSVLEARTWMGGLYLGVHTRAFGGSR